MRQKDGYLHESKSAKCLETITKIPANKLVYADKTSCDEIIIPVQAAKGLESVMPTILHIRRKINPNLKVSRKSKIKSAHQDKILNTLGFNNEKSNFIINFKQAIESYIYKHI